MLKPLHNTFAHPVRCTCAAYRSTRTLALLSKIEPAIFGRPWQTLLFALGILSTCAPPNDDYKTLESFTKRVPTASKTCYFWTVSPWTIFWQFYPCQWASPAL